MFTVGCGLLVQIFGQAIDEIIVSREWFITFGTVLLSLSAPPGPDLMVPAPLSEVATIVVTMTQEQGLD